MGTLGCWSTCVAYLGSSPMQAHLKGSGCRSLTPRKRGVDQLLQDSSHLSAKRVFTPDLWVEKLLNFITIARFPFRIVEHPEFKDLVELAQLAPSEPGIPSTTTIRSHLHTMVEERQQKLLQKLLPGGKLSITLDC